MPSRQQRNTSPVRTISDFKSKLSGGGARPNLFEVVLSFPDAAKPANQAEVLEKSRFLVKAAALPASTIASVDVPFSCLLYTSPSPRDRQKSRMPSSA